MQFALLAYLFMPSLAEAAGLVPCNGTDCRACDIITLGQNVLNWLVGAAVLVAVLMFAISGFQMVMAAGNESQITKAKSMMTMALIGLIVTLASWLIVDTIMKAFTNQSSWYQVQCVANPEPSLTNPTAMLSRPTAVPLVSANGTFGPANYSSAYYQQVCQTAQGQGLSSSECSHLQAIMATESSGNPNAISSAGCVGLMQVCPSSACRMDNSIPGCNGNSVVNQSQVTSYLQNPTNNMNLGVQMYGQLRNQYTTNGATNYNYVYAAYNGGPGANLPSRDCSSGARWECNINPGGYVQTQQYVKKVTAYQQQAAKNLAVP